MNQGKLEIKINDGIATVSFFHEQSNSLPGTLLRDITAAIESTGKNDDVKIIILRSEGEKTFCAGASFDELASISNLEEGKIFFSGFASVINAIRKAPKFVIIRVQGKAVGGGVGLACAADYALATVKADVKLSELAVGIGPFVVGPAVERKIGTAAFSQLSINATQWQTAQWAKEKGMYAEIYNSIDELDHSVNELANTLVKCSPAAMKMLKQVLWQGTEEWDRLLLERAEISGKLVLSDFTRTAIARFKQGVR